MGIHCAKLAMITRNFPNRGSSISRFANRPSPRQDSVMIKLCIFVGTTVGGYAGWALGEGLGLGFGWAFVLSSVGSIAGVYGGWKLARKLEE